MSIQPIKPQKPLKPWIESDDVSNKKTYFMLSMILFLMQTINPKSTFVKRFKKLLRAYPNADVSAMGFPKNWEDEKIWK